MSPEGFVLIAEMIANNEINLEAILEYVHGGQMALPLRREPEVPPTCSWCGAAIWTPHEAFVDDMLTTLFGYVYCSEACRDNHVNSK
jgi:hypothetical protein